MTLGQPQQRCCNHGCDNFVSEAWMEMMEFPMMVCQECCEAEDCAQLLRREAHTEWMNERGVLTFEQQAIRYPGDSPPTVVNGQVFV